ncbi:MAG TPA: cytochrome c biogenesis protein CcsA, partial [Ornithinimicrobium sp.]|uniref:cytochrome c biogenesis protein CcsA n=1 Tax=Ornithinimicrobium sp. TaxID=1977084 RepID=UPI002B48CE7A
MRNDTLAVASDIGVWVTIVLLAVAMLAFAAHLAVHAAAARPSSSVRPAETALAGRGSAPPAPSSPGTDRDRPRSPGSNGEGEVTEQAPSRRWGVVGLQVTLLSTLVLVASTALRGLSVQRAPLGNMYEFALVACCFALVIYCGWSLRRDRLWLGLFVTGPVLLILGLARRAWYTEASQLLPSLESIWLVIHVSMATLAVGLCLIGFATATLYLLRDTAESRAAGPTGGGEVTGWRRALPPAESLERMTYGIHVVAFPLWTFTLIVGATWAEQAWGRYWGWDPKEVWTFVIFVVYAAYLHARATAGWTTR